MARPGLIRNRKFTRLARALDALAFGEVQVRGLGQSLALGSLEMMWSACYESGDEVVGTPEDVEACAAWSGPAGVLFAALRDAGLPDRAGFIEEHPERPGVWRVHDLWDHAPEYVAGRREKEQERKRPKTCVACGGEYRSTDYRSKYCSARCRTAAWRDGHVTDRDGGVRNRNVTVTDCDGTPAPAPAPAPAPPTKRRSPRVGVGSPAFEAVEHWRGTVWPKLSTAECPDLPADQVQSLAALCGKHGPPAVMAAMDAAAADSFWHGKLDLSVFISKFPRFLGRKTGAQATPGRKRVVGVDDNGQPIFSEDAA